MCCSVLQCVAVCCSVLQCVAVCCSVLKHTKETSTPRVFRLLVEFVVELGLGGAQIVVIVDVTTLFICLFVLSLHWDQANRASLRAHIQRCVRVCVSQITHTHTPTSACQLSFTPMRSNMPFCTLYHTTQTHTHTNTHTNTSKCKIHPRPKKKINFRGNLQVKKKTIRNTYFSQEACSIESEHTANKTYKFHECVGSYPVAHLLGEKYGGKSN